MTKTLELPITVAERPRNDDEVLRLTIQKYRGQHRADLRIWRSDGDGSPYPTIPLPRITSVRDALRQARARCVKLGLLTPKRR